MIDLSVSHINAKSPYNISGNKGNYEFITNNNIRYRIRFIEETPLGGCETYQFAITKLDNIRSSHDPNISATIFLIIDEFFSEYENVLLYICDTSDGREASRNRLFIHWFEKAAHPNRFTIRSANAEFTMHNSQFIIHNAEFIMERSKLLTLKTLKTLETLETIRA